MPDLSALLNLAQNTAENAFRIIEKDINKYRKVEEDLERDVKILADKKLESFIIKQLLEKSQYPVLSEEAGFLEGRDKIETTAGL